MAFAAVTSLDYTMVRHTGRTDWKLSATKPQVEEEFALMLVSLKEVLKILDNDDMRGVDRSVMNELDAKITEAARKVEDVLESYVLNHSLDSVVEQEMDLFLKKAKELRDEYTRELEKPWPAVREDEEEEDDDFVRKKSAMVGLWDQFEEIRNELLDLQPGVKIVSLVGMAGIGKSHLARQIYQHPTIIEHFDLMVWVRVGVKHEAKNTFVDVLAQIERKPRNAYRGMNTNELASCLDGIFRGRTCLIVLDDVWSRSVCDHLKWFRVDGGRRRILLTTRLEGVVFRQNMVITVGNVAERRSTRIHEIRFLNDEESWDLLWRNVFLGEESFPPELEKAGRKIAENCEGLPLLILTVAGILCGLDKTEEYWMKVANKKTTTFIDAYEKIENVLRVSYDYMPQHLKPCFLYMGVFPQSTEIPITKLFNLWSVEDFLESTKFYFPNKYVEELVSSSVLIACKHAQCSMLRIKSCKLHSAYWYLCVKEARRNKFFHVLRKLSDASEEHMEGQNRLSVQNNILFGIKEAYASMAATLTTRSLLCTGEDHEYPVPICFNLALLRVLDALAIRFYEFPEEVMKLVRLRYLALTHNGKLPPSISKLNQLECLILRPHHNIRSPRASTSWLMRIQNMWRHNIRSPKDSTFLPMDIWNMQHLRYLRIMGSNLPYPSNGQNLCSLSTLHVNALSCTKAILGNICCLRKLVIDIELQPTAPKASNCFKYIRTLKALESLKCVVVNPWLSYSQVVAPPHHLSNLPKSLTKLSLNGLGYSWKYITAIGLLGNLEVLKLRCSAFRGAEWETGAGQFPSLEFLVLEDIDMMHWRIDNDECFRRLEQLVISHCYKLKEIPRRIGTLPKMKRIEVVDCSPSAVASAEAKRSSSLKVVIDSSWSRSR